MRLFLISTVLFIIAIAAIILIPTPRNWVIKKVVEFSVSSNLVKLRMGSLSATAQKLHITDAQIFLSGKEVINIEKIAIDYDLNQILSTKRIKAKINIEEKSKILGKEAITLAHIDYSASSSQNYDLAVNIEKISSSIFSDIGLKDLTGKCNIVTTTDKHIKTCHIGDGISEVKIDAKTNSSDNTIESLLISGKVQELTIDLHKILHDLVVPDETVKYLHDNVSGAFVKSGNFEMNLDKEFFTNFRIKENNLKGEFRIENIKLSYDPDFPTIEKINTTLKLVGSLLDFEIDSAKTGHTILSNGKVLIDLGVEGDAEVIIKADAKGPSADLAGYIPKEQLESLKNSDIDLTKLKGVSSAKVEIIIPIGAAKNKYNISADLSNIGLSIFENDVVASNGKLKGSFDGNQVKIEGPIVVNDYKGNLTFVNNLDEKAEFDNILDIKLKLAPIEGNTTPTLFSVISGQTMLDISYKDKGKRSFLSASAPLTNIGFNVDKLGISKNIGEKATLEIKGESGENDPMIPLTVKLIGAHGLSVIGEGATSSKLTKISFSKIRSGGTNIKADIESARQSLKVKITGNMIDLSQSNMMQFLTKDTSDTATDINISLENVKLKNDILLDNFTFNLKCDRKKCHYGIMGSNVGTKTFGMVLTPQEGFEEWKISTTNAGAILNGLGLIKNIKSGTLFLLVKTNIKEAEPGQIVPIAAGNFTLSKFVTVDNKLLTRLASFVSLPGLMSAFRNNKDISFSSMVGKFSYKNEVLTIYDGTAEGPFLDLTLKGTIFTNENKAKIKGTVIPSLYGISSLVQKVPVLGTIFGGKHRRGIFSAPYSLEFKY